MALDLDLKRLGASGRLDLTVAESAASSWVQHLGFSSVSGLAVGLDYRFSDQGLYFEGALSGKVQAGCNLCDRPTHSDVRVLVRARYLEGSEAKGGKRRQDQDGHWGIELDDEAGELEYYSGHHLDLTPWLRDEWALGLPVSLHCGSEACREGAAGGQDPEPAIDPRWQFLADLKAQMEEEG